jgi:hypothetical protein
VTHAENFSADPGAWQRIEEKVSQRARPRLRGTGWLARHSSFVIPATAAATVVAVALGAVALSHGLSGTGDSADRGATVRPSNGKPAGVSRQWPGPSDTLLATDPSISAFINLKLTSSITTHAWIGQPSPLYWFGYITAGPEFCHEVAMPHSSEGYCWPMSNLYLSPTQPADVVDNQAVMPPSGKGAGNPVITGVAESSVTSVTAVLPDGRRYHGVVGTGKGFGRAKAWSVTAPAKKDTKLIFTGAAGQIITELSAAASLPGPASLNLPRPAHGDVTVFHYPSSGTLAGGTVSGYLVNGHVAFFSSGTTEALPFGGAFSPNTAAGAPAIDGLVAPFRLVCAPECRQMTVKAFGYAHGDVAKVVVPLPSGGQVTAKTFRAGWPGSDLWIWQVTLPDSTWSADGYRTILGAIAYDAAGHAIGQALLGQPGAQMVIVVAR